jgi:phage terminase large subunit-like protein
MNPTRTIEDFKKSFFDDPQDALMRFACMPSVSSDAFFKSREKIEKCLNKRNPIDSAKRIDETLTPDPNVVYYVHADLAQKHDKCAVSIAHVDKWVSVKSFNNYEQIVPLVVVDAIVWWEPHKEGPVDLSEVKNWIINLRRIGFNLGLVTFDRWQSFDIQQELKQVGIKTSTLSVAKKHYEDLAMLVYEERLIAPHIDILREELLELRIISNRVDHPRKKSKDLADAMCGSVYNSIANTRREKVQEIEVHTWKTTKNDREFDNDLLVKPEITPEVEEYLASYRLI